MIDFSKFNSIIAVINHFNSEKVCKEALAEARWGEDVVCPICGKHHCARRADGRFRCNQCKHNFSCTVGVYHDRTLLFVWACYFERCMFYKTNLHFYLV